MRKLLFTLILALFAVSTAWSQRTPLLDIWGFNDSGLAFVFEQYGFDVERLEDAETTSGVSHSNIVSLDISANKAAVAPISTSVVDANPVSLDIARASNKAKARDQGLDFASFHLETADLLYWSPNGASMNPDNVALQATGRRPTDEDPVYSFGIDTDAQDCVNATASQKIELWAKKGNELAKQSLSQTQNDQCVEAVSVQAIIKSGQHQRLVFILRLDLMGEAEATSQYRAIATDLPQ